jgi:U5 small nuclear ribonucleoprotein component
MADEEEEVELPAAASATAVADDGSGRRPTTSLDRAVVDFDATRAHAVVLAEDKDYYPSAAEVYPEAEVLVQDEDTQPLDKPVIEPARARSLFAAEEAAPETTVDPRYLTGLMDHPRFARHVAVAGHLHHGKTTLIDLLVQDTHSGTWGSWESPRFTDSRADEQARGISLKAAPISLAVPDLSGKHHLLSLVDTPGHLNCSAEVTAGLRLADSLLLVVDAVEGVMLGTEKVIAQAVRDGLALVLCVSKVDRLILELKLPPADAYHKLARVIAEVNAAVLDAGGDAAALRVSPERGNVMFASALHGWVFTLPSFAQFYSSAHGGAFSADKFALRLWGNSYLRADRSFGPQPDSGASQRTFVQFILEPLYKVYAHALGSDLPALSALCAELSVPMSKSELALDAKPLLRLVLRRYFADSSAALCDVLVHRAPSPVAAAAERTRRFYTGDLTGPVGRALTYSDSKGPLVMHAAKSYPRGDGARFDSFCRVLAGTVRVGDRVRVLGPRYSAADEEDMTVQEVTRLWVYQAGRYKIEVNRATAGNWVLVEGLDGGVYKAATVVALDTAGADVSVLRPLQFGTTAGMKVAVEPLVPSELPKVLDGLRRLGKCYPLVETRVLESGEHVVFASGELEMDSALHDLREHYAGVEIKVSDPSVRFGETVAESSSIKCFAETRNKASRFAAVAEPLDAGLAEDIEAGAIACDPSEPGNAKRLQSFFQTRYDWDILAARSVWAFGPDASGPNILCDDTLPSEVDKKALAGARDALVDGFQWAMTEGPLCGEPVRGVKVKIVDAAVAAEPTLRSRPQVMPTMQKLTCSTFLLATPRLLEPVLLTQVLAPADCLAVVTKILTHRRGRVLSTKPRPGTPLFVVEGTLPQIESFGFETDVRTQTHGLAFCMSTFDHWGTVPGDPLDKSIVLQPLQVAPIPHLAREFMVKTRRRKGLSEDVAVASYFDEAMLLELAKNQANGGI